MSETVGSKKKRSKKILTEEELSMQRELFAEKNAFLVNHNCTQISSVEFYKNLFDKVEFEVVQDDARANMIISYTQEQEGNEKSHMRNVIVTQSNFESVLNLMRGNTFAVTSPVTFFGRNRTAYNAHEIVGLTIDLDYVGISELINVIHQVINEIIPTPAYIVNSGTGLHLYYKFESPIPAYHLWHEKINTWKYALIERIWNDYTSQKHYYIKDGVEHDPRQYQPFSQGYRVIGSLTKIGTEVTAFQCFNGHETNIDELNKFVRLEIRKGKKINNPLPDRRLPSHFEYTSRLTLAESEKKYPDWYDRKIVHNMPAKSYIRNRALYDWWFKRMSDGATVGHRYWCCCILVAFAYKCAVPIEEVKKDLYSLVPLLNKIGEKENKGFSEKDAERSLRFYNAKAVKMNRDFVETQSAIKNPPSRRNGRSRADHIKLMNFIRDELNHTDWRNKDGAPTKEEIVKKWRKNNPDGTKAECIRATGLTKPTVYKWW